MTSSSGPTEVLGPSGFLALCLIATPTGPGCSSSMGAFMERE